MTNNYANKFDRGCEPLTGDDIAEVIVFAAGRRENVVIADTLIFPSHQVSYLCAGTNRLVPQCAVHIRALALTIG